MGEYAKYNGRQIKIGSCEEMFYLRADQVGLIEPVPNSVDLAKHPDKALYRFPWPDEDGTEPGAFDDPFRLLILSGATVPDGVSHYSGGRAACNDEPSLTYQRWWNGLLVAVCQCAGCHAAYRLPEADDVRPVLASLHAMAAARVEAGDELGAVRLRTIADRVAAGYVRELTTMSGAKWYGTDGDHWYASRESAVRGCEIVPDPWCNHDAPAVVNGMCECGALVLTDGERITAAAAV